MYVLLYCCMKPIYIAFQTGLTTVAGSKNYVLNIKKEKAFTKCVAIRIHRFITYIAERYRKIQIATLWGKTSDSTISMYKQQPWNISTIQMALSTDIVCQYIRYSDLRTLDLLLFKFHFSFSGIKLKNHFVIIL